MKKLLAPVLAAVVALASPAIVLADTLNAAVAANFTKTIEEIGAAFKEKTGHEVKFSFGPTGKLYAQIKNGAPFDLFFAADTDKPEMLVKEGLVKEGSYFVYAQGVLALYSPSLPVKEGYKDVLGKAEFAHLSIANPKTAPYGAAAEEVLKKLGVYDTVKPKIVNGESIAHAFQYVQTGNAPLGFVALSQIVDPQSPAYGKGEYWLPGQDMYAPINQGAVILKRAENNPVAQQFIDYLRSDEGRKVIERYG
ncbi:MAG: molybdate ABC transporter substrate-binding protein, partial [Halothiobacillaceae bacterium]|nr:molybdate ABC transporter substrate-binding protein [Halothiobacillaceae bacterium]